MKCHYCSKRVECCKFDECEKEFKIGKRIWCVWDGCGHYCSEKCMKEDEAIVLTEVVVDSQEI